MSTVQHSPGAWRKPRETSVGIAGSPAKTRTNWADFLGFRMKMVDLQLLAVPQGAEAEPSQADGVWVALSTHKLKNNINAFV